MWFKVDLLLKAMRESEINNDDFIINIVGHLDPVTNKAKFTPYTDDNFGDVIPNANTALTYTLNATELRDLLHLYERPLIKTFEKYIKDNVSRDMLERLYGEVKCFVRYVRKNKTVTIYSNRGNPDINSYVIPLNTYFKIGTDTETGDTVSFLDINIKTMTWLLSNNNLPMRLIHLGDSNGYCFLDKMVINKLNRERKEIYINVPSKYRGSVIGNDGVNIAAFSKNQGLHKVICKYSKSIYY